jgi:serine/threonine protein kinase
VQRLSKYVQRELSLHSKLQHPFVIGFKRVFFTEDFLVVVLEYASEGSLARFRWPSTYPQRKPLAIYFFQQLIAAIKYCHEHGIVHRDLKHENTLLHMARLPSGNQFLALKVRRARFAACCASSPARKLRTRAPCLARRCPVICLRLCAGGHSRHEAAPGSVGCQDRLVTCRSRTSACAKRQCIRTRRRASAPSRIWTRCDTSAAPRIQHVLACTIRTSATHKLRNLVFRARMTCQ